MLAPVPKPVRALLVADDPLVRGGFSEQLADAIVAEASGADALTTLVAERDVDVVLWDLGPRPYAPDSDGVATDFVELGVPVVVLGSRHEQAATWLSRSASGVLRRDSRSEQLRAALEAAAQGLVVVDPAFVDPVMHTTPADLAPTTEASNDNDQAALEPLTARELEVLQLLTEGLSNKRIAGRLGISTHTAKFHVGAILDKLDVASRTEAVIRAVQSGWVLI